MLLFLRWASDVFLHLKNLKNKSNVINGYYAVAPEHLQRLGHLVNFFVFKRVGPGETNTDSRASINANLIALFDYFEIAQP